MCYVGVKYVMQMKMRLHVPSWEVFSLRGLVPLLKLALPNILMMTEWWASEIVIFLSGLLPQPELHVAAMSIFQNTNSICFMLPAGIQTSGYVLCVLYYCHCTLYTI